VIVIVRVSSSADALKMEHGGVLMGTGSSDRVRAVAAEKYVLPAILAGKSQFSVAVRDVMKDLQTEGFPAGNYPQVCTALRTGKFLKENGLEIEGVDGPPSGLSTTVVVHYRVADRFVLPNFGKNSVPPPNSSHPSTEAPAEKAHRLTEKLRGLLKIELKEYGGGEAFLRWVRSEDEVETSHRNAG
jgi:hypothetical protein